MPAVQIDPQLILQSIKIHCCKKSNMTEREKGWSDLGYRAALPFLMILLYPDIDSFSACRMSKLMV